MPTTPTKLNSRSGGGSDEVSDLGRQKRNGAYYVVCISTVVLLGFIAEKEICVKSLAAICKAFLLEMIKLNDQILINIANTLITVSKFSFDITVGRAQKQKNFPYLYHPRKQFMCADWNTFRI